MEEQEERINLPFSTKAGVFAASAPVVLGIDALAHLGAAGIAVGGVGAFILAKQSPEIYAGLKDFGLWPRFPEREPGKRTIWDKLINRYPTVAAAPVEPTFQEKEQAQAEPAQTGDIRLASDLVLSLDDIAGKSLFIAGQRRSGKTTLGIKIAEELGRYYVPLFFPDLMGDALSMVKVLPRGKIAGHPSQYVDPEKYEPVTPEDADVLGFSILDDGLQVVLDVASYETVDEAYQVVIGVIQGLFEWCKQHLDDVVPCHVFLDEAQSLVPEHLNESILEKETARELLSAYTQLSAMGGKYGLTPAIFSQRFAQTNNKIMAQSEIRVIMRQTNDNDVRRCMEYVRRSVASEEDIAAFQQGQGVWIGADGEQRVISFLNRRSDGRRSHTPKASAAQRYAQMPMSPRTRKAIESLEEMEPLQPAPPARQNRVQSLEGRAIKAWNEGYQSGRKLAAALGIGESAGNQLMNRLLAKGLISKAPRSESSNE